MQHYFDIIFEFIVAAIVSLMICAGFIALVAELRP
jgi:hypothetical protein